MIWDLVALLHSFHRGLTSVVNRIWRKDNGRLWDTVASAVSGGVIWTTIRSLLTRTRSIGDKFQTRDLQFSFLENSKKMGKAMNVVRK